MKKISLNNFLFVLFQFSYNSIAVIYNNFLLDYIVIQLFWFLIFFSI